MNMTKMTTMPVVARGSISGLISAESVCSAPGFGCLISTGIGWTGWFRKGAMHPLAPRSPFSDPAAHGMPVLMCPPQWSRHARSQFFSPMSLDTAEGRLQVRELGRRGSFLIRRSRQTLVERPRPPQRRVENIFPAIVSPAGKARARKSPAPPALELSAEIKGAYHDRNDCNIG